MTAAVGAVDYLLPARRGADTWFAAFSVINVKRHYHQMMQLMRMLIAVTMATMVEHIVIVYKRNPKFFLLIWQPHPD